MIKNLTKQKIAIATAMTLALITAQAQSADGNVVITGQINANTCKLNIADNGGVASPSTGTRSIAPMSTQA
jgi:type 1 fimbria pilin